MNDPGELISWYNAQEPLSNLGNSFRRPVPKNLIHAWQTIASAGRNDIIS